MTAEFEAPCEVRLLKTRVCCPATIFLDISAALRLARSER
jgi:hypothetical protein